MNTLVVRPKPGHPQQGILQAGPLRLSAALGRSGIVTRKREGDGGTPRGQMRLLSGFHRGKTVATSLPMRRITANLLWCDAPAHPAYNRLVRLPLAVSHERLLRQDDLYDFCLVMDWNVNRRQRGCGSAIFFHQARPGYRPTEGCVAVAPRDMRRLLPHLSRRTVMKVMGL
ncbi:L,D-transpeptidase family protein [Rhizobium paknamense]|uniref:L,D-peptidoglycan transpeptidase YkuD (ErfK/YbiS/YcfS/YnhG family) n=1 Tax=Rhizobium paknamense TaxID=1206817 RepID=A0ABU0IGF8_9HYPH|nr:L,D-transpeptidase family protein [Rhizobium paknamense]MDQ0457319.1 L,D-peptidoglycan transpeptidase YkuD (ErfK/YbiS/YcfS/YnhG family) [Rhizobium paknamense]